MVAASAVSSPPASGPPTSGSASGPEATASRRVGLLSLLGAVAGTVVAVWGLLGDWWTTADSSRNGLASFGGAAFGAMALAGTLVGLVAAVVARRPRLAGDGLVPRGVGVGAALGATAISFAFHDAARVVDADAAGAQVAGFGSAIVVLALLGGTRPGPPTVSARWVGPASVLGGSAVMVGSALPWLTPAGDEGAAPSGLDAASGRFFAVSCLVFGVVAVAAGLARRRRGAGRAGELVALSSGVATVWVAVAFLADQPKTRLAVGESVTEPVQAGLAGPAGTLGAGPVVAVLGGLVVAGALVAGVLGARRGDAR